MSERRTETDQEMQELLEAVAESARRDEAAERQRFDNRLERLAAGTLGAEEQVQLEAEAETSDELRLDLETFRPLDAGFESRVLDVLRERSVDSDGEAADSAPATRAAAEPPPSPAPPAEVVPIGHGRWPEQRQAMEHSSEDHQPGQGPQMPRLALIAALVAAAVGLLWLGRGWLLPATDPAFELADYTAELVGQRSELRGPDDDGGTLPVFDLGTRFRLVLTPDRRVANNPQFELWLAGEDGTLQPWEVGYRRSPDAALEIDGVLGTELPIAPGRHTLVFLYGRPGALPDAAALTVQGDKGPGWRAVRVEFEVAASEAEVGPPLEVLYSGCYAVTPGPEAPLCVPYRELTFWLRTAPQAEVELRAGGRNLLSGTGLASPGSAGQAVDGGRRYVVPVKPADGSVEVTATVGGATSRFLLALGASEEPKWFRDTRRLAFEGGTDEARSRLEAGLGSATPALRGSISSLLARLEDDPTEQQRWLEEAMVQHRASGRMLELADDLGMLLRYHDIEARRFAELRQRLDAVDREFAERLSVLPGEAAFHFAHYRGILENDVGNFRAALVALDQASALARRLGLVRQEALAEPETALALARLGRNDEAVAIFRRLGEQGQAAKLAPCERARLANNHAWVLILGGSSHGDPLAPLERGLEIAAAQACDPKLLLDLWLNRGLAHEQQGQAFEARQALAKVEALADEANTLDRLWWLELEGRLALADGQAASAIELFAEVETLATQAFEPRARWRAKVAQAEAHNRLGDHTAAIEAYEAAEDLLDDQSLLIPFDAGRESFVSDHGPGTRALLALLLEQGRHDDALRIARRARVRVLSSIHRGHRLAHLSAERQASWDLEVARYLELRANIEAEAAEDWRLSAEARVDAASRRAEQQADARRALDRAFQILGPDPSNTPLPPLAKDELVLAYHPLPSGWAGFAARLGVVEVTRFELEPQHLENPQALAERLLLPFAGAISEAERLRVLPIDELREVDFHALPWNGDVLLAARPVVYGLDLPTAAGRGAELARARQALVVGDPRGDLPAARIEAGVVAAALEGAAAGFEVSRLDGDNATLPAVHQRLANADLLHLAGHGVAAGRFGWDSAILLAGDSHLTLGDVLALERAPSAVVLSSCESARETTTASLGLGLAQAFLIAGSERVVAALRPVGDRDTEGLFRRLYSSDARNSLGARLRSAQLAFRAEDPAADWASFRLIVP